MLHITLDKGQDTEASYEFNQDKLMASEASMLQKYTGRTLQEWNEGLQKGDIDCLVALIWLAKKRSGEVVRFEDVDFDLTNLDVVDPDAKKEDGEEADAVADVESGANPTPSSS